MTTSQPTPPARPNDELAELVAARYGRPEPAEFADSDVIELQLRHRSVRRFTDEQLTEPELLSIVAAAQSASQSSNLQVWSVVAVRDADRKRRLSELLGGHRYVEDCSVFLVWVADFHRAARLTEQQGLEATTVGYLENTLVSVVDCGIAAQNALLAAESLGLGGVFVGSIRNDPPSVVAELGLPDYVFPVVGLALGRPDPAEAAGTKPRLPMPAVLHREQYGETASDAPVAEYETNLADYYADYGKPDYSWAHTIVRRLGSPEGMHGRAKMREWLAAQGFESN